MTCDLRKALDNAISITVKQAETIKGYQSVINIANESNATQQECIRNLNETIKGLDRRTREYQEECARLQERIDTLLEAQASVPTRDVNGTIEAQQSLIRKLKGDVLTLQRKVDEQDEKMSQWANDMALQTR